MPTPLGPGREFELIRRFLERARPPGRGVAVGPGDDCAVVEGGRIAVSADLSIEDVHFRRAWLAPEEIGYRAAAASLSDLAAMAASPVGALVSLAAPPADVPAFAERCMAGAREAVESVGATLLGGDLTRSPGPLLLDVVVLGRVERPVLRGGARPGDELWVTGALGGAAAAVRCWERGEAPPAAAREAFARPRPRIREALWLAERDVPRALIDLSDGLAGDAAHLAAAGRVGIVLDEARIPVHPAAAAVAADAADAVALAIGGGEDYELCFAARPGAVAAVEGAFRETFGTPLTCVGVVREEPGVAVRGADGTIAPPGVAGYRHFAGGSV
ncbi:MAG TPA: thiamine-phosphate kinase [Longimicrobiales bacterium]